MTLNEKLNNLLANNRPDKAIDLLMERVKDSDPDIYNALILIKSRYSANEKDNNLGILSRSDYQRTNNQIIYSFQQTMDKVPEGIMNGDSDKIGHEKIIENNYNQKEMEGNKTLLNIMVDKLNHLKKELVLAYDAEKKFVLQEQIKELEVKSEELKMKISDKKVIKKINEEQKESFDETNSFLENENITNTNSTSKQMQIKQLKRQIEKKEEEIKDLEEFNDADYREQKMAISGADKLKFDKRIEERNQEILKKAKEIDKLNAELLLLE